MAITISDGNTSMEWTGVWTHKKSGFQVDLSRMTVRQVLIAGERGLTHVYGSEAAAKANAEEKRLGRKLTTEEKDNIVTQAREEYRDAMYNDTWATGTRTSRAAPGDRLTVLFDREAARYTKEIIDRALTKAGKDMWLDADGNPFGLDDWVGKYLDNDDPDPDNEGMTIGQARRARHMEEAKRLLAEEQRRAVDRVETKKIIGTKI